MQQVLYSSKEIRVERFEGYRAAASSTPPNRRLIELMSRTRLFRSDDFLFKGLNRLPDWQWRNRNKKKNWRARRL